MPFVELQSNLAAGCFSDDFLKKLSSCAAASLNKPEDVSVTSRLANSVCSSFIRQPGCVIPHVCAEWTVHASPLWRTRVQYSVVAVVVHGSIADMMGFGVFSSTSADERGGKAGAAHADSGLLLSVRVRVGVRDWRDRLCRQEQGAQRQDL